jgi:YVTN family beta-propeller protein
VRSFGRVVGLVAAVAVVGCGGDRPRAVVKPAGKAAPPGLRLVPLPATAVAACHRAQAKASFTVLCPARLPRAIRGLMPGVPPSPLVVQGGSQVLDFGYSGVAGPEGSVPVRLNAPARFVHFVVGRAFLGVPPGARPASLGGHRGQLAPATPNGSFGSAPYYDNHVRFVWRERGTRYIATLHTFGEAATERLLDRLLRELRPANSLHAPASPEAQATIFTRPSAVALGFGAVWVTTANATYRTPSLLRVDPQTLQAHGQRGAGQLDVHVAAGREGLWTVGSTINDNGHAVSRLQAHRIDPASGRIISRTPLAGLQGGSLAVGASAVWVSANRFRWRGVTAHATGTVWRIDPSNGDVTARTRVPGGAGALLVANGSTWALSAGAPLISRIDARTARVTGTVRVGGHPVGLAASGGAIWVTDSHDGTLRRIDPKTLRVTSTTYVGRAPFGIAADDRGLWIALLGEGVVARIDPATARVTQRVPTGGDPVAVAADGHHVWVALNSDHALLRLDR